MLAARPLSHRNAAQVPPPRLPPPPRRPCCRRASGCRRRHPACRNQSRSICLATGQRQQRHGSGCTTRVGWRTRGRSACEAMVGVRTWLSIALTPDSSCPAPPRTARWRRPQGWLHREHRPPCHQDRPPPRAAWASPAWLAVARAEHKCLASAATRQTDPWRGARPGDEGTRTPAPARAAPTEDVAATRQRSSAAGLCRGGLCPRCPRCPRIGITTK